MYVCTYVIFFGQTREKDYVLYNETYREQKKKKNFVV